MGIIIIPILLIALVAALIAIVYFIFGISQRHINIKNFGLGLTVSILLFAGIIGNYKIAGKMYALGIYFKFPIVMIVLPFILFLATIFLKNKFIAFTFICSIICSILLLLIFQDFVLNLPDRLHIDKLY